MSDTKKLSITVPDDIHAALSEFAGAKGVTISDAVAALIRTAVGRRAAVNNYAARKAEERAEAKAKAEAKATKRKAKKIAA